MPGFLDKEPISRVVQNGTVRFVGGALLVTALAAGATEVLAGCTDPDSGKPPATTGTVVLLQGTAAGGMRGAILQPPQGATVTGPTGTASTSEWSWSASLSVANKTSGATSDTALYCFEGIAKTKTLADVNSGNATEFDAAIVEGGTCDKPGKTLVGVQLAIEPGFKGWQVTDESGSFPNIIGDPTQATHYADVTSLLVTDAQAEKPIDDALLNTVSAVEQGGIMATASPQG